MGRTQASAHTSTTSTSLISPGQVFRACFPIMVAPGHSEPLSCHPQGVLLQPYTPQVLVQLCIQQVTHWGDADIQSTHTGTETAIVRTTCLLCWHYWPMGAEHGGDPARVAWSIRGWGKREDNGCQMPVASVYVHWLSLCRRGDNEKYQRKSFKFGLETTK